MPKKLLIVESPAKAKTIGKYLGGDFVVKSSVGHVRDLPKESGAIKVEKLDDGLWRFLPTYVVSDGKEKVVSELKSAVKSADEIYLASDHDREGEAIAWHLKSLLEGVASGKPFYRVTYNEITKRAVLKAISEPRDIDLGRVDAQQARRILDRLVGYKVSPILWRQIQCPNPRTLSAGRVQSVALRLLVERQREIEAFCPETYFLMGVEAKKKNGGASFVAKLSRFDGEKPNIKDKQTADNIILDLAGSELVVGEIKNQAKVRHPYPPFTTSTLQQAASSVLGFSPGKTMKLAQGLYEAGLITYMRTDSVNVSDDALKAAKDYILQNWGGDFYPEKPNFYKSKADAQGAHEAIRPTDIEKDASAIKLDSSESKLYDLIWRRFIASQMAEAKTNVRTVLLDAVKPSLCHSYRFSASTTEILFEGFLKVMKTTAKKSKKNDDGEDSDSDEVSELPELKKGEELLAVRFLADAKETKGPSHYSEASLIKALEENGVGRPSTYAATIETLKAREYAVNEKRKLIPVERGILVCDWLVKKLDSLFNVGYTALMESELDKIEEGSVSMDTMLSAFYEKFVEDLHKAEDPPPNREKFECLFSMLSEVSEWNEPRIIGKRVYDDKVFVDSLKEQFDAQKSMSARQFEYLVRMVGAYASQISDAEDRLRAANIIFASAVPVVEKADPQLVLYCFETMDRIGGMMKNPFLKSLREQVERGRGLSKKQFSILARAVGENARALADGDEIREKLSPYVPEGFDARQTDPAVPGLLKLMKTVTQWREPSKNGKKVYDDEGFVKSLADQYARRHSLSPRQVMALRRVAVAYKDQIPTFEENIDVLGLRDIPSSREKSAEVINGVDKNKTPRKIRAKKK